MTLKFKTLDPKVQQIDRISRHAKGGPLAIDILAKAVPIVAPERMSHANEAAYMDAYLRYSAGRDEKTLHDGLKKSSNLIFADFWKFWLDSRWKNISRIVSQGDKAPENHPTTFFEQYAQIACKDWTADRVNSYMHEQFGKDDMAKVRWIRTFHVSQGADYLLYLLGDPQISLKQFRELRYEIMLTAGEIVRDGYVKHHPVYLGEMRRIFDSLILFHQRKFRVNHDAAEELDAYSSFFMPETIVPPLMKAMMEGLLLVHEVARVTDPSGILGFIQKAVAPDGYWKRVKDGQLQKIQVHPDFQTEVPRFYGEISPGVKNKTDPNK